MTKRVLFLILFFLLPLTSVATNQQQVVEISVKGMFCKFCVYGVKKKLKKLGGVQDVTVSLENNHARIVMAPKHVADVDAIRNTITEAGFTPGEAKSLNE